VQRLVQEDRGVEPAPRRRWAPRGRGESVVQPAVPHEEGGPDEGGSEGSCRPINTRAVKVLTGIVLVVAL
jgi:hypothetical protein